MHIPKSSEKGIAHLLLLLLLAVGLVVGVYLVTQKGSFNIFPKASLSKPTGPETSFTLVGPAGCNAGGVLCAIYERQTLSQQFEVKIYARSDIEKANLFAAKMTFPKDLVEVTGFKKDGSFVKNWVEEYYDNTTGEISLVGGVPTPGYQTTVGQEGALMATIVFNAKAIGKDAISFTNDSQILSDRNNINILTTKRGYDINVEVKPSPTPVASPMANFGKAAKFARGDYYIGSVDGNRLGLLNPKGVMTMEAWIKLDAVLSSTDYTYFIEQVGTFNYPSAGRTTAPIYYLQLASNRLTAHVNDTSKNVSGFASTTFSTDSSNVGIWHHIAGVYDGKDVKIFVDGQLKNTGNLSPSNPLIGEGNFYIQGNPYISKNVSLPLTVDEVRISNTARYSSNFTLTKTPFTPDASTILLWDFNKLDTDNGFIYDSSATNMSGLVAGNIQFVDSTISQLQPVPSVTPIPTPVPGTKGDGNKDGKVNLIDMSVIHTDWMKTSNMTNFRAGIDMNDDTVINTFDFGLHRNLLLQLGVIKTR